MSAADAAPNFAPDYYDLAGLAHALSISKKQAGRLLSAGRLPQADLNIGSGSAKGRRWRREKVLAWLEGGRRA